MDKDTLLKALAGTLDLNQQVRKQSEQQLHIFEEQTGFTAYLLDLIIEQEVTLGIQISAAILFKNRVANYWVVPENKTPSPITIKDQEKPAIKEKLIQTLIKTYKNNQIKVQLANALHNILGSEKWLELIPLIKNLLHDTSNIDHVHTALICLYEYTRNYRWSGIGPTNPVLEEVADDLFPSLEALANNLIQNDSTVSDEMLYLIIKIFKFTTFSMLPSYFKNPSNLGNWCQLHLVIINKPLPQSVLNEDSLDLRSQLPRIKTVKWCFGNLHRLLSRHGGGFTTKKEDGKEFADLFVQNFVPEILNAYWKIIEEWSSKKIWLLESSLYHLISFLEENIETQAWPLISEKLDAIIRHVILPTLNASDETIELYEDEPDEYIRRFFDINREANTSDIASINFVFRLLSTKFKVTINQVLNIINEIFNRRASARSDISIAKETEGAFRVLSTISHKLDISSSPVHGQVDKVLHTFVYPELSAETTAATPWLTARACDTLAMFRYSYKDQQVLQDIFQGIVTCFQNQQHLPIQLTAVDALSTLVDEDSVAEHISEQAPQLMGNLLEMSKTCESDILTSVMEKFVEKFARNLEPYAHELASKLAEQFLVIATDLLDQQSGTEAANVDVDKEYQAAGILSTLTTLVIAMTSSPEVAGSMENVLQNMIRFILDHAMVSFLTEAIEILESILFSTRVVTPTMWGLFDCCIGAFETYAYEYCDSFQPFFESIINHGFTNPELTVQTPYVQSLLNVCFTILKGENLDPIFADSTFEILELTLTALNDRFVPILPAFLPEIFDIFIKLETENAFDDYMLHHLSVLKVFFAALYVDPVTTIQFLNEKQFTANFFKLWMKNSADFQSVYGCKLQILASVALVKTQAITMIPEDLVGESVDLLLSNVSALPGAIRAREEILTKERSQKEIVSNEDEEDEYGQAYWDEDDLEADEAELEAMKQTPIDSINVFEVFSDVVVELQHQDGAKYQALFGGLDQEQQELVQQMVKITEQQKAARGN
ncbi:importin-beta like protein [Suhomyces tanzawaensis NRRL Y-17324]|uniref:Importin-beta like protein n=1 Tax=Suhomyces tanzawaensis NRRL Y-17324 TaxID=984487 RepID=A0A1E4SHI0_9ASCO|nr:importin-beta like protein [Suhomyces tanzawaensis NRRL Y-17324]ODV78961.1 importin-beta like protein [Suhomyces tanzawaensis NRRL Y-17324]